MNNKVSLGDRMKSYENVTRMHLPKRCYIMIRLDGKAFHTFTKSMEKPFDKRLCDGMISTAAYLCSQIQGCKLGYVQSDEITLCLTDFDNINSGAWFDGNIQKIVSVSASMASTFLYNYLLNFTSLYSEKNISNAPLFDSRVWTISSLTEVYNTFLWRQQDCIRNAIQSIARSVVSHKECMNKNCEELKVLIKEKGVDFNTFENYLQRGTFVYKKLKIPEKIISNPLQEDSSVLKMVWFIDKSCGYLLDSPEYITEKLPKLD